MTWLGEFGPTSSIFFMFRLRFAAEHNLCSISKLMPENKRTYDHFRTSTAYIYIMNAPGGVCSMHANKLWKQKCLPFHINPPVYFALKIRDSLFSLMLDYSRLFCARGDIHFYSASSLSQTIWSELRMYVLPTRYVFTHHAVPCHANATCVFRRDGSDLVQCWLKRDTMQTVFPVGSLNYSKNKKKLSCTLSNTFVRFSETYLFRLKIKDHSLEFESLVIWRNWCYKYSRSDIL